MAHFEDAKEQIFHDTLEALYAIGKDEKNDVKDRIKALDEVQKGYLTYRNLEGNEEGMKTVSKAINQTKRLMDED